MWMAFSASLKSIASEVWSINCRPLISEWSLNTPRMWFRYKQMAARMISKKVWCLLVVVWLTVSKAFASIDKMALWSSVKASPYVGKTLPPQLAGTRNIDMRYFVIYLFSQKLDLHCSDSTIQVKARTSPHEFKKCSQRQNKKESTYEA